MKKTILPILISFSLVACGGGGGSANKKDESTLINPKTLEKIETTNTLILTDGDKFLASYLLAPPSKQAESPDGMKDNTVYTENITVTLDGQKLTTLELANISDNLTTKVITITGKGKIKGQELQDINERGMLITYKQDSSAVIMSKPDSRQWAEFNGIIGKSTPIDALPVKGVFTYNGSAFGYKGDQLVRGELIYKIDLENNVGTGVIRGLIDNDIALREASLVELKSVGVNNGTIGISGKAEEVSKVDGQPILLGGKGGYELGVFGNNGKEIAGYTSGLNPSLGYENIVINGEPVESKDNTAWKAGFVGKSK
ncbi:TPA: hypothetical protein QB624_000833 [Pasteurella multocida]|nr:hypothetical protein [Pasteurella multocida]